MTARPRSRVGRVGAVDDLQELLSNGTFVDGDRVMEARLLIEPRLAGLAAVRGTPKAFAELNAILQQGLASAKDRERSHQYNDQLHLAIARAARNRLLLGLFETLFEVRALTSWGKLQAPITSAQQQADVWTQHSPLVAAIVERNAREAEHLMRQHIEAVQLTIVKAQHAWLSGGAGGAG